jgi:hypothetical protein
VLKGRKLRHSHPSLVAVAVDNLPLIEATGGDQAMLALEGGTTGRFLRYGLDAGVDNGIPAIQLI